MLKADGLNEAIIGMSRRYGQEDIIAYDVAKIIEILMGRDGMSREAALEFFDFNILGAWVGDYTPCFIYRKEEFFEDDLDGLLDDTKH